MDVKQELIEKLQLLIVNEVNDSNLMEKVILALSDYEITLRETSIVVSDSKNVKILKRYASCLTLDGKSEATINQYVREVKNFLLYAEKEIDKTTTDDIRCYLAKKKLSGISNSSLENTRSYISAFYNWAFANDIIVKNPSLLIKPIKCEKKVKTPFTDTQVDKLKSACRNKKERALIEFLLATGVRVSELANMEIDDVDFDRLTVKVRKGKGGKERYTFISSVAAMHLKSYLNDRNDLTTYLFSSPKGRLTKSGIEYIISDIGSRINIEECHPHKFRRTFATLMVNRGVDIQQVKTLLGHTNINTTLMYVYQDSTDLGEIYRKAIK